MNHRKKMFRLISGFATVSHETEPVSAVTHAMSPRLPSIRVGFFEKSYYALDLIRTRRSIVPAKRESDCLSPAATRHLVGK